MNLKLILSTLLFIAAASPAPAQQYKQLTDVPTVYIETENGQNITSKEEYIMCTFTMVDGDNTLRLENTQIRGRGNSSWWNSDKKPYRVKFDKKQTLLGEDFAKAKSWTLLANHGDKTMIRNALTYQLGRFIGMKFCPAAKFIDLYLNGKYRGTYQISDQVQVHKKRVEVDEDNGWLLEVANEYSKEDPYITSTRYGIMYNIKNPDDELLTMDKRIAIGQWLEAFEKAVTSNDYKDPEKGYRAYIDETDFINWYVGAELTGNIDALFSIYMYKEADEQKMHFGPLWDLDLGYDNSSEKSLLRQMEAYLGLANRPFEKILQRLWQDPWFAKACTDRMNQLVEAGLEQHLLTAIDSLRGAIWQSQTENFKVWPINQQVYSFEKHKYHNDYDSYISDLKAFVSTHIPYLQQTFAQKLTATGITAAKTTERNSSTLYDLQGRKVQQPNKKGIYIQNRQIITRQ
ncbi:MAG: hypothetical protein E7101_07170 [Prevotella ruminicola]|uniref:CotH protein n=1 Tax=Xylanibacter ruminicola TaxID=839 RepID=A0A9D5P831_XYLRU|nr:hypothetical protein [Xylanibacter ruminicola]